MTFLCDPGWYVHKPDVQNTVNGMTTHTLVIVVEVVREFYVLKKPVPCYSSI